MRKYVIYLIIGIILLSGLFSFTSVKIEAGALTNTTLRLNKTTPNTQTGGLVCAKTPSVSGGTTAKVSIFFPAGLAVNSSASNWTVTTTNLPSGANAWPGIGTALSVSGQTVTFPSSNLATDTYYCFNFSSVNTLTTGSIGDNLNGSISTLTSANSTIDTKTVAVSIVSNDQISVSAKVAGSPSNFDATTTLSNSGNNFPQNTTLNYTITYGSNLTYAVPMKVKATWSLGTISGGSTPTVDILNYVSGSATDAYGSTAPVIDTVNRTITWDISSFPGQTNRTVSFSLKTNSSYTGGSTVSFSVSGSVEGLDTQTPQSTITKNYLYSGTVTPTPTPTQGPTNTPTPGENPTSTPPITQSPQTTLTPIPTNTPIPSTVFEFKDISVNTIFANRASVNVSTNRNSAITVSYGTSPSSLSSKANNPKFSTSHNVELSGLSPDTTYYFKVLAIRRQTGQQITSDTYTFKTASPSIAPEVDLKTFTLLANNNLLINNLDASGNISSSSEEQKEGSSTKPVAVIPTGSTYEFTFSLEGHQSAKRVRALLKNKSTLGVSTDSSIVTAENTANTEIEEIQPGLYAGRLVGQPIPGNYELYIQIQDEHGNLQEQKIAEIKISKPFSIFSSANKKAIEDAIVLLYLYNTKTKIYKEITNEILGIKNPSNTDNLGQVPVVLAAGKYKAKIQAIGYAPKTIEFAIGPDKTQDYPQVYLEKEPFNLITQLTYYWSTIVFIYDNVVSLMENLSTSIRFFNLAAISSMILLVITLVFSFSVRTHMRLQHLPVFFLYNIEDLLRIKKDRYVEGRVNDQEKGNPLSKVYVKIFDAEANKLIAQTQTNKLGEFYLRKPVATKYKVVIEKQGYNTEVIPDYLPNALVGKQEYILEKVDSDPTPSLSRLVIGAGENFISFMFELLLLNTLLYEAIFIGVRGFWVTIPYLLITLFTIFLWLFYARRALRKTNSAQY